MSNIILGTIDAGGDGKNIILLALGEMDNKVYSPQDFVFSDPQVNTNGLFQRNSFVLITPVSGSGYYGTRTVYYDRVNISTLGVLNLTPSEWSGAIDTHSLLLAINNKYGIYLKPSDVVNTSLPPPDGSGNITVTLSFTPSSIIFYGGADLVLPPVIILSDTDDLPEGINNLYFTQQRVNNIITPLFADKVDKVSGKQLSSEDYTPGEKSKLAGIEANANNYVHPATHHASIIEQDIYNRFVTDAEKSNWNSKQNTLVAGTNISITGNTISSNGISDAPADNKLYARKNNTWSEVTDIDSLGDMKKQFYDPQNIESDTFDRSNHTGTQGIDTVTGLQTILDSKIFSSQIGVNNGIASLDTNGKVPASQLPTSAAGGSLLQFNARISFPTVGDSAYTYVATDTGIAYYWDSSTYEEIKSNQPTSPIVDLGYGQIFTSTMSVPAMVASVQADAFDKSIYRSVKYFISAVNTNTNDTHILEILSTHNNTVSSTLIYGEVSTGDNLFSASVDCTPSEMVLTFVPLEAPLSVRILRTLLT